MKFGILRRIPNLRKISASPKADLGKFAEEAGRDYVVSFKPNPAIFVGGDFSRSSVRRQLSGALEKCQGCNMEIILKDISTLGGNPKNLECWAESAMELVEGR